jgi:formiminotetrahydrofolate cyclodeaminase
VTESLAALLERIAESTPTPGGGTASAICGALSAALSRMVANLAVGKQGYEGVQFELPGIEARGKALQARFLVLAEQDAAAYDGVVAAMALPKASDGDRATRKDAMQDAYKAATEVPLETIRATLDALELAKMAAEKGNRNAITDAGVAALLAQAGMIGASLNVRINLAAIADEAWRAQAEADLKTLLARGARLAQAVDAMVESRI